MLERTYDSVTIGTGLDPSDANSQVIGTFDGSGEPEPVTLASELSWVHFLSDSTVCYEGFWIVVTTKEIYGKRTVNYLTRGFL